MSDYDLPKMPERSEMIAILDLTLAHGANGASAIKRFQALRDHTLFTLALAAGLRSFEMNALTLGVVFDAQAHARESIDLQVYKGSGRCNGETQRVDLARPTRGVLEHFWRLKHAAREPLTSDAPLFCSQKGSPISTRQMRRMFKEWQALAGVTHDRTLHGIRHAAITTIFEQSRESLVTAQAFARHKDVKTTSRYVHVKRSAVKQAIDRAASIWAPSAPSAQR